MIAIVDLSALKRLADRWVGEPVSLSQSPQPPVVIGLCGTLGAGKTRFTQEICRAAGIDVADVTSPTFTLLQTHRTERLTIHHLDAYRVSDADEFWELGVEECWQFPESWTIVEWADRVKTEMPDFTIWVDFDFIDDAFNPDAPRRLTFHTEDAVMQSWLNRVLTSY